MLQFFIHARSMEACAAYAEEHPECRSAERSGDLYKKVRAGFLEKLRKAAGVTLTQFNLAWSGRLNKAAPRLKLWGACGVVPGDYGIILTDDGGQQYAGQ